MCQNKDFWWLIIFLTILCSSAFGGFARCCWDQLDGEPSAARQPRGRGATALRYMVMGTAAGFMVPLFLNTISSTLIQDSVSDPTKLFILIGFGVVAGVFAKQFMGSVARKALELSRQASATAREAIKVAETADSTARNADNRAISLYQALQWVDRNNFEEALQLLNKVLDDDAGNTEAWAWRGFCLKRLGNYDEAALSMKQALRMEGREVFSWLFNLACYRSLAGASADEVMAILKRALATATPQQRSSLQVELKDDDDFGRLRSDDVFNRFIEGINS